MTIASGVNSFLKILEKIHADLIFYLALSLFLFISYWGFSVSKVIGLFLAVSGFSIWITAIIQLGDSFQVLPRANKLITTGIYSKIRNPIYLSGVLTDVGILIFIWDVPLLRYVFISFLAINLLQIPRVRAEEKVLKEKFGRKYIKYKEETWF